MPLADGDLVDNWLDASGQAVTVSATGTARPTFKASVANGHDGVRFSGAQGMTVASPLTDISLVNGISVFVVATNLTTVSFGAFIATDSPAPRDFNMFMSSRTGNSIEFYSDNQNQRRQGNVSLLPGPTLITCRVDVAGAKQDVFVNGANANTGSVTLPTSVSMNGATLRIGRDGFGDYLNGDICEIAFYERAVTDTEKTDIETALMAKYGIV